jgi:hypothetical protein
MTQLTTAGGPSGARPQLRRAEIFAGLHRPGDPLLLPNAWDAASAVTIEGAGAKAIATTSAGVAAEMLASGTYETSAGGIPYDDLNAALRPGPPSAGIPLSPAL